MNKEKRTIVEFRVKGYDVDKDYFPNSNTVRDYNIVLLQFENDKLVDFILDDLGISIPLNPEYFIGMLEVFRHPRRVEISTQIKELQDENARLRAKLTLVENAIK